MNKIAIVEDDIGYRDTLQNYISKYEHDRQIKLELTLFENADSFLEVFHQNYDIILMDIDMPGTNGMEAASKIRTLDSQVVIMFITNLAHFAIKGYEVGALDFILKPIQFFNFANKIDRAIQLAENRASKEIVIHIGTNVYKINTKDIYYLEVQNHILSYYTSQGTFQHRGSLKSAEEQLPLGMFAKCSNWCLVGLTHVSEIRDDVVIVEGNELQISRRCRKGFIEALIRSVGRS